VPGLELELHYANTTSEPAPYRDRRVVIIGKRNSAFEVGEALVRQGLRELTLVSPRPPDLGRLARSPLRPWYLTPYDEHVRGAPGRYVLDASVERVETVDAGYRVHVLDPARSEPLLLDADVVIAATGFRAPLADLPSLGLETAADGRLPALTPWWESVSLPGVFFAGNMTQAAQGLRKHGVANLSSMVCGFRYNARLMARRIAESVFAVPAERPVLDPQAVVPLLLAELTRGPELAMQKGYLARVLTLDGGDLRDDGVQPLEVFVDDVRDGVAATLEFDETEQIRPAVYVRSGGRLREVVLPGHPLRRFDAAEYEAELHDVLRPLLRVVGEPAA
jgi:hypothetical protein